MSLATRTKVKPPKELSATYSAVDGFAVTLRWTPVESGAQRSYFVVYRDSVELANGITENSYRDATVLEGENHVYSVATVNVNETEGAAIAASEVELPYYPVWEDGWSLSMIQGVTTDVSSRASDPRGTALTFSRNGGTAPSGVTVSSLGAISIGPTVVAGSYSVGLKATGISGLATTYSLPLTIQSALQPPLTPINLVIGAASTTSLNVNWNRAASGDAPTDYDVDYSTSASGPWSSKPHSGTATSTQITGLSLNTVYYVRVRANNSAGSSSYVNGNGSTAAVRTYFAGAPFEYPYLSPTPSTIDESTSGVLHRKNGGANILTLPITQVGTEATTSSSSPNTTPIFRWGLNSLTDTHIVTAETITEGLSTPEIVLPREGTYFWRQKIYRASGASYASPGTGVYPTKHYDQLNSSTVHTTDGSTCRPRNAMSFQKEAVYGFDRDAEVWMGFSLYIPTNWEHETYARGTTANGPMLLTLLPSSGNSLDTNSTHLTLNAIVPDSGWTALRQPTSGATKTHWCIQWYRNPTSTQEANVTRLSLGEIQLGKWTDFVFNMRWNPFTGNTTVLGTTYVGNSGKIRLWCGEQNSNGTRSISSGSPLYTYSGPCGNYPSGKIIPSLRVYMFGWNNANTSSRSHPVWVGADAFRWGFATGSTMNTYQGGAASTWGDVAPGDD